MKKYLATIPGAILCVGFSISCSSLMTKTAIDTLFSKRSIDKLLVDIDSTQTLCEKVEQNIDAARNHLFDLVANQERKAQLGASEKELAEAEADVERITIELKQAEKSDLKKGDAKNSIAADSLAAKKTRLAQRREKAKLLRADLIRRKDEIVLLSQTNGDVEKVRLSGKQADLVGKLIWNLSLATLHSQRIVENSISIMSSKRAKRCFRSRSRIIFANASRARSLS